jgi:DNA-binding MarR family transcriptional regulator
MTKRLNELRAEDAVVHEAERIEKALDVFLQVGSRMLEQAIDPDGTGITQSQLRVVRFVYLHDGPTLRQIADALLITPSAATQFVDKLVKRGLAVREEGDADRREVNVRLTERGARLARLCLQERRRALAEALGRMSTRSRAALAQGLESFIVAALDAESMIERACLRCGIAHRGACPVNAASERVVGEERTVV